MKKKSIATSIISLVFLFVVSLTFYSCTQESVDVTNEIIEANKGFMKAFNSADMDALVQNYTVDAKLYPPNSDVVVGREVIGKFWTGAMEMGVKKVVLETVNVESYGGSALEVGTYTIYFDGDAVFDYGKYMVAWKKIDGQWQLDQDIWNTSQPLPQTEEVGSTDESM
ncbi:YybH family protein [Bacteroidota bacterium]